MEYTNVNLHRVVQLLHASHGLATSNSHNNYNSNNNYNGRQVIPKKNKKKKKQKKVTGYASYFCAKSSPIKLLHVNMYTNFLTVPSSTRYYCPNLSHIR